MNRPGKGGRIAEIIVTQITSLLGAFFLVLAKFERRQVDWISPLGLHNSVSLFTPAQPSVIFTVQVMALVEDVGG